MASLRPLHDRALVKHIKADAKTAAASSFPDTATACGSPTFLQTEQPL